MRDPRQEPLPTGMMATAEQHEGHCQSLLQAIAQDLVELGLWHPGHRNLSSHPSEKAGGVATYEQVATTTMLFCEFPWLPNSQSVIDRSVSVLRPLPETHLSAMLSISSTSFVLVRFATCPTSDSCGIWG